MGLVLSWIGAVVGFAVGSMLASALGLTPPLAYVVAGPVALLGLAAWIYSPLPDTNGGYMAGPMNTGWGWSSDDR